MNAVRIASRLRGGIERCSAMKAFSKEGRSLVATRLVSFPLCKVNDTCHSGSRKKTRVRFSSSVPCCQEVYEGIPSRAAKNLRNHSFGANEFAKLLQYICRYWSESSLCSPFTCFTITVNDPSRRHKSDEQIWTEQDVIQFSTRAERTFPDKPCKNTVQAGHPKTSGPVPAPYGCKLKEERCSPREAARHVSSSSSCRFRQACALSTAPRTP
jgi:hypothetical protein